MGFSFDRLYCELYAFSNPVSYLNETFYAYILIILFILMVEYFLKAQQD